MRLKKILTISLTIFLFSANNIAFAGYSDVDNTAWYADYIEEVTELELIDCFNDGTFRPEENMSNAEFVTAAVKLIGITFDNSELYMNYARERGYVLADEMLDVDDAVTRQRIAKVISRILELETVDEKSISSAISDWDLTCPKCKTDVAKCYANGIMSGYEDGTFRGRYPVTRAEAAVILINAERYLETRAL